MGQDETEIRNMFMEAESYYQYEEYLDALPIYMKLKINDPENEYLNYKIGSCYLHIPFRHERAIPYLKKACENIDPKAKKGSFRKKKAPPEALYNLANAYRINNQLKNAIATYQKFKSIADSGKYDFKLIDDQIRSCENAGHLMKDTVIYRRFNLGPEINTRFSETNPVVSADGKTLVFVSKLQFYDALFFSKMKDGKWSKPLNLIPYLGVDGDVYPTSLSADGTEMYLYRNDGYIGNLYYSKYYDGEWHPIIKLNDNINTKYWESHACVSNDGKKLYFTSNRKGGYGGLDIYVSEKDAEGNWGPASNLGAVINTPYNEETPFITENGQRLYFSSYGHYNIGGYDIFYSVKKDTGWETPVNLGYPVNTTDDDLFFMPAHNGAGGYYAFFGDDTYGQTDLYYYNIFSDINPRTFKIRGSVSASSEETPKFPAEILLINKKLDTVYRTTLAPGESTYSYDAAEGNYTMVLKADGFNEVSQNIDLKRNLPFKTVTMNFELTPLPVSRLANGKKDSVTPPKITLPDNIAEAKSGETIIFPLQLNSSGMLNIQKYVDGKLISEDKQKVNTGHFDYRYKTVPGNNLLKFTLTTEDGQSSSATVKVKISNPKTQEKKLALSSIDKTPDSVNTENILSTNQDTAHIANNTAKKENESEAGFVPEADNSSSFTSYKMWITMTIVLFSLFFLIIFYRRRKNKDR